MTDPVKLGVIGCGEHGRYHAGIAGEDFEVTALFDPLPDSISAMREIVGADVPDYKTEAELVAQDDVDAVLIASTDENHAKQALAAARAGKHVFCDKPLGISVDDFVLVDKALDLAEESGSVMASCHPRRSAITDLTYGWVAVNLPDLVERFGRLGRVWLNSIYPRPRQPWKEDRSFLLDKYVHDKDFLLRLRPGAPIWARRQIDSHDHYGVEGTIDDVEFTCGGTRLHGAENDYVEIVHLEFKRSDDDRIPSSCTVYSKTGLVRFYDARDNRRWTEHITPMESEGYDRVFTELMGNFARAIRGEQPPMHSPDELRIITGSAIALAGPSGLYRSR